MDTGIRGTVLIFQGRPANRCFWRRNYLISKSVPHQLYHEVLKRNVTVSGQGQSHKGLVHFPFSHHAFKKRVGSSSSMGGSRAAVLGWRAGPFNRQTLGSCSISKAGDSCFSPSLAPKSVQEHCRQLHSRGHHLLGSGPHRMHREGCHEGQLGAAWPKILFCFPSNPVAQP